MIHVLSDSDEDEESIEDSDEEEKEGAPKLPIGGRLRPDGLLNLPIIVLLLSCSNLEFHMLNYCKMKTWFSSTLRFLRKAAFRNVQFLLYTVNSLQKVTGPISDIFLVPYRFHRRGL